MRLHIWFPNLWALNNIFTQTSTWYIHVNVNFMRSNFAYYENKEAIPYTPNRIYAQSTIRHTLLPTCFTIYADISIFT